MKSPFQLTIGAVPILLAASLMLVMLAVSAAGANTVVDRQPLVSASSDKSAAAHLVPTGSSQAALFVEVKSAKEKRAARKAARKSKRAAKKAKKNR